MPCSNLIDTYTNSKYLFQGVSRYKQSFTCGKCASCIKKKRTDWRVRAYYEALGCLKKRGSFVLFDTLTYCDSHIKRYSDIFPEMSIPKMLDKFCFSRDDVQKFFKRLRINLKRAGYCFRPEELRYILTSEYGSSEETNGFKNTHRPHYHILFFVTFAINPIEFSRYVSRSWHLGKTDGVRPYENCVDCPVGLYCKGHCLYQLPQYVVNERLVNSDSTANCMKCVNYVTKYISKDMYMSSILQENVDLLWRYLSPDYREDILQYRKYRVFCNQVLPFHLQSMSFGWSLMSLPNEKAFLLETNTVHLPTSDRSVVNVVALPRYYQRRLFYMWRKVDGRVFWYLSPFGVDTKVRQLDSKISSFMRDYRAYDAKISDSRLYDLALYDCVYRGTFSDYQSLLLPYKSYYRKMLTPHFIEDEKPLYFNHNTYKDKITIGKFLSTGYFVDSDGEIHYKGRQHHKHFIPYDGYLIVNDKVCSYWYGFDKLLIAYHHWKGVAASALDALEYQSDFSKDYYKQLGLLKQ